jgi:putative effector of murein hydrolase LrgA (UPF0299 family)
LAKLSARYNAIALPIVLSGIMSFLVSGVATYKAIGLPETFLAQWIAAWSFSWPIAALAAILALPLARHIVGLFVEPPGSLPR